MDRLRVEQDDPYLAGFEPASPLHRLDQLFVVHMAVTEVPPDGGAADPFPVGDAAGVLVGAPPRPVPQGEQGATVSVEAAERVTHVKRNLGRLGTAVEPL